MALTIYNSITRYCFGLMRDWKLKNVVNSNEISHVPFKRKKYTIFEKISRNITDPPKFLYFLANR